MSWLSSQESLLVPACTQVRYTYVRPCSQLNVSLGTAALALHVCITVLNVPDGQQALSPDTTSTGRLGQPQKNISADQARQAVPLGPQHSLNTLICGVQNNWLGWLPRLFKVQACMQTPNLG